MSDNSANIISLVELAAEAALRGYNDYRKARELALQSGITDAEMAESDARFAKSYIGPPPETVVAAPPALPPAAGYQHYSEDVGVAPDETLLKPGDIIWQKPNGHFHVQPAGVGYRIDPQWQQVKVIGS